MWSDNEVKLRRPDYKVDIKARKCHLMLLVLDVDADLSEHKLKFLLESSYLTLFWPKDVIKEKEESKTTLVFYIHTKTKTEFSGNPHPGRGFSDLKIQWIKSQTFVKIFTCMWARP